MRTNYIQRASLVSALLLFLAGCMVNEAVPEPTYIEVKASLSLETKAYLATTETLNLKSKWKGNEKIYVFLRSGEEFLELGDPVSITSVSDDGTSASFRFQIPTSWQSLVTQPGTVINCFTSNCNPVLDDDGRLQLSAPLTRKALAEYEAPIYCEGVVENRTLYANFHHLWVYELLHFTNKSSKACDFSLCGFNAPSGDVWYAYNGKVYFDSGLSAGINSRGSAGSANATKAGDLTKSPIVTVGPGASDIIVSSYYPTGGKIKDAQLVAEIDGEFKYSTNTKSSTVELQRGHAYHMYAEWDGSELKFVDAPKDEAFELSSTDVVFDDTAIGSKSKKCITVKNTGTKALTFSISSVNDSDIFSWSPEEPTCLGPGDESEIEITFMPETEGTVTGFLDFSLDGLTCAAVIKCTGNGVFSTIPDDIVIERDFQINLHHVRSYQGGQYFSSQRFVIEFDNNIYWRVSYQYDDYAQKHGVFIDAGEGVDDSVKKRYLEEKTTEVIYDEWVHEKICIGKDGSVSYFQNGVLLGSFQAPEMSLDESQSFRVLVNPYGWWTGHYQWMDNFSFQYGSDYFFDDFNSGMLDTNLWNISDAVTGSVYVEDGFVKCDQISTDKNCKLASRWFSFDGLSPEPEYIDLELPSGIKWATCNLGASKPEDYGGYYQWGGLEDVTDTNIYIDLSNCPYHTGSSYSTGWTKYIPSNMPSYWSGSGAPDNKTVLDPEDDVAHVKLGGKWRMPTLSEFEELINNCTCEWTTLNGVNGRKFTSKKNGNSIFLPAAGYRYCDSVYDAGSSGNYWSSSLLTDYPGNAYYMYFYSDNLYTISYLRYHGFSVRPVSE